MPYMIAKYKYAQSESVSLFLIYIPCTMFIGQIFSKYKFGKEIACIAEESINLLINNKFFKLWVTYNSNQIWRLGRFY